MSGEVRCSSPVQPSLTCPRPADGLASYALGCASCVPCALVHLSILVRGDDRGPVPIVGPGTPDGGK